MAKESAAGRTSTAIAFTHQSEKLSLQAHGAKDGESRNAMAVEARFITPQDPVIETDNGARLPAVPLNEALELNKLRDQVDGQSSESGRQRRDPAHLKHEESVEESSPAESMQSTRPDASLRNAMPPSRTHPLFPELPLYGPPSLLRDIQCIGFRLSSAVLSVAFLGVIVLGSAFTSIPLMFRHIGIRLTFRNPDARRPFYKEERRRQRIRDEEEREWKNKRRRSKSSSTPMDGNNEEDVGQEEKEFEPTEGGRDPLVCDVGYYARRVGLDAETYEVMTEDGFIIQLVHIYNPKEYTPASPTQRAHGAPAVFLEAFDHDRSSFSSNASSSSTSPSRNCKYPILLMHGLLQSSGAYCVNDDSSLAFYLCKSGYDVWLGNNRCGFNPQHQLLNTTDPRMWNWNIRQMGVMDLPALVSRVLSETGFPKLGLICHSQGTTETFVALAKEQRPDLGEKISVFCALAPAVYAGPLIGKMYIKFMRIISPGMFRIMFGIHSFIPFMMTMHYYLPGRLYGALGYRVFSFLFNWTDDRWDQGIRDRLFQFSPVYVSAESMRWWLGRECFASQKCILATREEGRIEDEEDKEEEDSYYTHSTQQSTERMLDCQSHPDQLHPDRGGKAWFNERVPPFALWVAGSDELVDGRRLLRRFEKGREPHVRVVHSKIIEEYEHLDVIWAIDSVEKVGNEVREVLWRTVPEDMRKRCRVPKECEGVSVWDDPKVIANNSAAK